MRVVLVSTLLAMETIPYDQQHRSAPLDGCVRRGGAILRLGDPRVGCRTCIRFVYSTNLPRINVCITNTGSCSSAGRLNRRDSDRSDVELDWGGGWWMRATTR